MLRFPDLDFSSWLRSASAQSDNRFHIGARQIYILPTRFGLMFSVLVIAMLIGSINYANNLGFLLTFFLAGVGVISIVHTWLNLLDLEIVLFPVKPVFAGQDLAIQVRILNPSPKLRGSIELQVAENSQVVSHDITANTEQDFFLKIPVSRRGRYVFPRLTVSTQFPLGLFNAWCYINHPINAIVYAKNQQTIGVGAGQMSRVNSARIAAIKAEQAGLEVAGSVMASDAFFPFRDGLDNAAQVGIRAVIQPGGSMRDEDVIQAADEHDIAMVFTGMRHFRH